MEKRQSVFRETRPPRRLCFSNGIIDLSAGEIRHSDGGRTKLSEREVALLKYLLERAHRTVLRDDLLINIWVVNPSRTQTRTVDMHMSKLRRKLREDPASPRLIVTVRGEGYRLEPEDVGA